MIILFDDICMTVQEAIERFRDAAIRKENCKTAKEDHRLHGIMLESFHALRAHGTEGHGAFERLLEDQSLQVRSWVAAQMLSEGDERALPVLEQIRCVGGILGFDAEVTLKEFRAGRLGSPFPNEESSNKSCEPTPAIASVFMDSFGPGVAPLRR